MKWIGRILYFIFLVLIVMFIEGNLFGINGIQRSLYVGDKIANAMEDNEDFDVYDGIAHINTALGIYYSDSAIKNADGGESYDTTGEAIDDLYKVKFSIYPMISAHKNRKAAFYEDGFYIVLDEYNEDVFYYTLSIVAYNVNDPEKTLITRSNKLTDSEGKVQDVRSFNIYLLPGDLFVNSKVPRTTYIANYNFYDATQDSLISDGELHEYDIVSIGLYAVTLDEEDKEVPTLIYRVTDGEQNFTGAPLVEHTNLNLTADTYNISKNLEDLTNLTASDIETYNIVTLYHPIDLSDYTNVYFIVFGIYIVFIVIIPYFWFFHGKIMAAVRARRPKKAEAVIVERPKEEQLFSDVEPKSDDK